LLAEDNATNQMVFLEILGKLGYRAEAVADGKEAIDALRSLPYDLVLMDCEMPELNGFETSRRIRSGQSQVPNPDIPIIAITAYAMKGDRERCLAAGMNDYLSKPIQPEELARALDHWLAKKLDGEDDGRTLLEASAPSESGTALRVSTRDTAGEAPAEEVIFDRDGFLERVMGDESLARKVMNAFLADMPIQIEKMKDAIGAGDSLLAGQQAHRIKGAAANLGGMALQGVAFSMERAGKVGDLEVLGTLLADLQNCFVEFKDALENGDGKLGT
jgi:CheY-like chemotaxis protein/HPt (histidine-containing phosphotransfer) domain-containing protein